MGRQEKVRGLSERGQATVEYIGLILLTATIFGAVVIAKGGLDTVIVEKIKCAIAVSECAGKEGRKRTSGAKGAKARRGSRSRRAPVDTHAYIATNPKARVRKFGHGHTVEACKDAVLYESPSLTTPLTDGNGKARVIKDGERMRATSWATNARGETIAFGYWPVLKDRKQYHGYVAKSTFRGSCAKNLRYFDDKRKGRVTNLKGRVTEVGAGRYGKVKTRYRRYRYSGRYAYVKQRGKGPNQGDGVTLRNVGKGRALGMLRPGNKLRKQLRIIGRSISNPRMVLVEFLKGQPAKDRIKRFVKAWVYGPCLRTLNHKDNRLRGFTPGCRGKIGKKDSHGS